MKTKKKKKKKKLRKSTKLYNWGTERRSLALEMRESEEGMEGFILQKSDRDDRLQTVMSYRLKGSYYLKHSWHGTRVAE